jgi:hypothetical protein
MLTPLDRSVLFQGISGEFISVPLYKVFLDCKYIVGPVTVGLVSHLPIDGVTLLLDNDVAGGKVLNPVPQITPVIDQKT